MDQEQVPKSRNYLPNINLDYYKSFLSSERADQLFDTLEQEVVYLPPEQSTIRICGRAIIIPRKHVAYGDEGLVYRFSGLTLPTLPWTDTLLRVKEYLEQTVGEKYNYCLINRYATGNDYVAHHSDDEKSLDPTASIATISLGKPRHMNFVRVGDKSQTMTLTLDHGSLLLMKNPTNRYYQHSILKKPHIYRPRVSLTFRRMKT